MLASYYIYIYDTCIHIFLLIIIALGILLLCYTGTIAGWGGQGKKKKIHAI